MDINAATVKSLIDEGARIVRELDPIMLNVFASDPAALAAWESASRVERPMRRRKSATASPAPPAPPQ